MTFFAFIFYFGLLIFGLTEWTIDKNGRINVDCTLLIQLKHDYFSISAFGRYLKFSAAAVRLLLIFLLRLIKLIWRGYLYLLFTYRDYKRKQELKKKYFYRYQKNKDRFY